MAKVLFDMTKEIAPRILITAEIIGMRKWAVRVWIATRLFKLGAWIMNVGMEIK